MDKDNKCPVVLVTGASAGIGLALVHALIETRRYRVVVTARATSLARLAAVGIAEDEYTLICPLDVTSPVQRQAVIEEVASRWRGVDILINNAGISYSAVIEHLCEEDLLRQLAVNFIGPMELIRLVLPHMRAQKEGRIVNVSSVGGMMAMPTMGAYSASKFALEGASEALWYEMRPWNIKVTLVQPGFVRSDSFERVYLSEAARRALLVPSAYSAYYEYMGAFIARLMRRACATPERLAARIVEVIEMDRPPLRLPATVDAYFFYLLRRLLPRRLYHGFLYRNLPNIKKWGDGP